MQIEKKSLIKFFGRENIDRKFINIFVDLLERFGSTFKLNDVEKLSLFLSQIKAEIIIEKYGRVRTRESLNYSASALTQTFGYFRKNPKLAQKLGRTKSHRADQESIANIVYADKNRSRAYKLGNIKKGDGWLFRGVGILQSTGRENVLRDLAEIENHTGINIMGYEGDIEDELLSSYTIGILLGMAHWYRKGLYLKKSSRKVTDVINRGLSVKEKIARDNNYAVALGVFS